MEKANELRISDSLALPLDIVTDTIGILAIKGSGKTYTFLALVEEMVRRNLPAVVIDTMGVCWGLRSSKRLEKISDLMADFPERKKRCYVMIGYDGESIKDAETRLEKVYSMGFLPFSQLYQGEGWIEYSKDWKQLNRKWSRPAAYRKGPEGGEDG